MDVVVGLVVLVMVVILPWIAAASAGGFDAATWWAIGRSKPAWFLAILLVPLAAVAYWLLVRPQLQQAAGRFRPVGVPPASGPGRG